jgi:hypothetical protein
MFKKSAAVLILVIMVVGMFAGCGGATNNTAQTGTALTDAALKIVGNVNNEVGWSEAEVRAMETTAARTTNKDGDTLNHTGVSLNTLLETAGMKGDATTLVLVADDGYTAEVVWAEVKACADCIVAFREEGGFSAVLPGFPGNVQVKGLVEIQVQ